MSTEVASLTLLLCGDVMLGRGVDQVLPHPSPPTLYEPSAHSAIDYVRLAEAAYGPIPKPVDFSYVWGDALALLASPKVEARLINLETAIATSDAHWKRKDVHYRMSPNNVPCLTVAGIDGCSLANNHVLDWGYAGLLETLAALQSVNIKTAGAGQTRSQAERPAVLEIAGKGRVLLFAFGSETSGIPRAWAATDTQPGVNLLPDLSEQTVREIGAHIRSLKQPGDVVVASIHWGPNWGYHIPQSHSAFAHHLIDHAAVDVVHGHSAHHVLAIEVYRDKLILYGCGDFINDYEGIEGYESFRPDLGLMYMADLDPSTGRLRHLRLIPTQVRNFRVRRANQADATWLRAMLNREGMGFGTRVHLEADQTLSLHWKV